MTKVPKTKDFPHDGKIYRHLSDKRTFMRYIIVLIVLMALCSLTPSIWAAKPLLLSSAGNTSSLVDPSQTTLTTTPSIASFLSNSWMPPSALNASVNNTSVNNTTTTTANNVVALAGESRLQFLRDDWTPNTPVQVIPTTPFKLHQMN